MTPDDIKTIRRNLGITQQQMADRLSVSVHTIRAWEQGTAAPGADRIPQLELLQHSPEVRRLRLSDSLDRTADAFEADGSPGIAAQLRRLAATHRAQRDEGGDPVQQP